MAKNNKQNAIKKLLVIVLSKYWKYKNINANINRMLLQKDTLKILNGFSLATKYVTDKTDKG